MTTDGDERLARLETQVRRQRMLIWASFAFGAAGWLVAAVFDDAQRYADEFSVRRLIVTSPGGATRIELAGDDGAGALRLFDGNGVERAELSVVDDLTAELRLGRSIVDLTGGGRLPADFDDRVDREPHVTLFARPASYAGGGAEAFDRAAQVVVGTYGDGVGLVRKVDGRTSIVATAPAGRDRVRGGRVVRVELDPLGGVSTTLDAGAGRLVLTAPESRPNGATPTCVEATDVAGKSMSVWPSR
jgi:hypothetical protein